LALFADVEVESEDFAEAASAAASVFFFDLVLFDVESEDFADESVAAAPVFFLLFLGLLVSLWL